MNIGLIVFLGSILLGNTGDTGTNKSNESQDVNSKTSKLTTSEENFSKNDKSQDINENNRDKDEIQRPPVKHLIISGLPSNLVIQDEYYNFTPFANDFNNDKLEFNIINKPSWAEFDSRTGNLSGQPTNWDVGITNDIIISVNNAKGNKASLMAFNIEVINANDKPIISGTPSQYYSPLTIFSFKPTVKDIDLDINQEKLRFNIENKPKTLNKKADTQINYQF